MIGDDKGLPGSIPGLFGTALGLYARRFPYYAILTVVALGVQYVVDTQVLPDVGLLIGLDVVVCSFIAASVSIGLAFDIAGKEADWSRIMTAASLRWGAVTLTALVAQLVEWLFLPYLGDTPEDTLYGLLLLPFVVLWGAITLSTVVAAIEPVRSRLTLPLLALGKGLAVSTRFVNLGRLMFFSVLLMLVVLGEVAVDDALSQHHIVDANFWADVPIDTILAGPLQAIATVFYLDFLRRARR